VVETYPSNKFEYKSLCSFGLHNLPFRRSTHTKQLSKRFASIWFNSRSAASSIAAVVSGERTVIVQLLNDVFWEPTLRVRIRYDSILGERYLDKVSYKKVNPRKRRKYQCKIPPSFERFAVQTL
jgi:hypothetical protein